jgi:hypothetical protein
MSTLQEALQRSGLHPGRAALKQRERAAKREHQDQLNDLVRAVEDRIRRCDGTCQRVIAVPFEHPTYPDDPHELAWSSRKGRWRLVLRWDDGADPVLCASKEVRAAVLGSEALRDLFYRLTGTAYADAMREP